MGVFNLFLEDELHKKFKAECALQGETLQSAITNLILNAMDEAAADRAAKDIKLPGLDYELPKKGRRTPEEELAFMEEQNRILLQRREDAKRNPKNLRTAPPTPIGPVLNNVKEDLK